MEVSIEFAFKYAKIKPLQRTIIEYLYINGKHEGSYISLTAAIGQRVSVNKDGKTVHGNEPNVRKAVIALCQMGLVEKCSIFKNGKEECWIGLEDDWIENVINMSMEE